MIEANESSTGKLLRGALAGAVAGVAASFAMDAFQAAVTALSPSNEDDEPAEPATEKAADGIAKTLTGNELAAGDKPFAGQSIHYALGISLGIAYGIAAEFQPKVTAGFGTAFGLTTATLLDETAVPAVGLGQAPWKAGLTSNLYAYASHLVYGSATELVRRQVASSLRE